MGDSSRSNNERNTDNKLARKVKHLEELNLTISHNLRGGVGNIKQIAELLMEKKTTKRQLKNSKKALTTGDGLKYIHDSSVAVLAALDTFMSISNVHLDENLVEEECDLEEMVKKITDQLQGTRKEAEGMHLFLAVKHIKYPPVYLESIMYNLISNALKYSRPGVPPEIAIYTYFENGHAMLKVKDNGIGIDLAAHKNKLFRLHQTFHKGYDSKGVGLYLTKLQVESMGGSISVKSKVNEGSEFTVAF